MAKSNTLVTFTPERQFVGELEIGGQKKDAYYYTYTITKGNHTIHLSQYELDKLASEIREFVGKTQVFDD